LVHKNKGVGRVLFLTHCISHLLFLVRLLAVWFAYKSAVMMLLIVPVRVQDSWCMGPGSVAWDFMILAGVRLLDKRPPLKQFYGWFRGDLP
jgi:hypothetical protein